MTVWVGTGKTTVARKMGQLYYDMGILGSSEYVECSASDLIGQYLGQTGPKTQKKMTEGLGRVLFVDEAYRFCDNHQFGKEAVNEIVDCLTKQKYMGKIVVILAGYTHQIDELLQINPGLSSRFPEEIVFENMDPERCIELLEVELKKNEIEVAPPLTSGSLLVERQQMIDIFTKLSRLQSWGNGRDVKNIAKNICSDAFANNLSNELKVSCADILRHLDNMLKSQKARNENSEDSLPPKDLELPSTGPPLVQSLPEAPIPTSSIASKIEMAEMVPTIENELPAQQSSEDVADSTQRDQDVSDEVWRQLQQEIVEQKAVKQAEDLLISVLQRDSEVQKELETARLKEIQQLEEEKRLADENRRKLIEEQLRQEQKRMEVILGAKREAEEKFRKAQEEAEMKRQQDLAVQKKIRSMGICPAGFRWHKQSNGYRCAGGSHYLSNSELGI